MFCNVKSWLMDMIILGLIVFVPSTGYSSQDSISEVSAISIGKQVRKTAFASVNKLEIRVITPNATQVPKFGLLDIDTSATYDNSFDPDDVKIDAFFTSPGGKILEVPGFFYQGYERTVLTKELRRKVNKIGIFTAPWDWEEEGSAIFYIEDIRLINSQTNKSLSLKGDISKWQGEFGAAIDTADFTIEGEKRRVMKLTMPVADKTITTYTGSVGGSISNREKLPYAWYSFDIIDWGEYDKLEIIFYPEAKGNKAYLGIGFLDSIHGTMTADFYAGAMGGHFSLNQWNTLEWNFDKEAVREIFEKRGQPIWKVRFTPTEVGEYTYYIEIRDRTGRVRSQPDTFRVMPSDNLGFVRISSKNPNYFQFDSGKSYFPISQNVEFYPTNPSCGGTYYYERYLSKTSQSGVNLIRVRMMGHSLGIEHDGSAPLGDYNLEQAVKLDWVLDFADKRNISVILTLDHADGSFQSPGYWNMNPYNVVRGGVINSPNEYFTDDQAKDYYQKRLRYIVACWGHKTNLLAWEFWNEVDTVTNVNMVEDIKWHKEMGCYLRQIDPYNHLMTTSFGQETRESKIWELPEMDITMVHTYDITDMAAEISHYTKFMVSRYGKPTLIGEFGNDVYGTNIALDPTGIHLHNGIWAGTMSGAAGSPFHFPWHWVEKFNLFYHFNGLAKFIQGEDFTNTNFRSVSPEAEYIPGKEKNLFSDLEIHPIFYYNSLPCTIDLTVKPMDIDKKLLSRVLTDNWNNYITFKVNYPKESEFAVYLSKVGGASLSDPTILKIYLDDELTLSKQFTDPLALRSRQYDGLYSIKVPSGKHSIKVVADKGHFLVGPYIFKNYRLGGPPDLRIFGLQSENKALFWVQNIQNTWINYVLNREPSPIEGAKIDLIGLKDGKYLIEWWDTYQGKIAKIEKGESKEGKLSLILPIVKTDVSVKVKRVNN